MSFQLIDAEKTLIPIETACAVLDVSTSGYYAWKNRKASLRQQRDMLLLAYVRAQFLNSNETYGSPRMHVELKEEGVAVGLHRVARIMQENGLKARQRTRFKKTTDSDHGGPVAPNVLDQDFSTEGPDEKWGVDISYVWTAEGWLYLAIVLDLFSRKIVGWAISDRMKKGLAMEALRRALVLRKPLPGLIHHSDRVRSRADRINERARQLLRQCDGRDRVQDHQNRVDLANVVHVALAGNQSHW